MLGFCRRLTGNVIVHGASASIMLLAGACCCDGFWDLSGMCSERCIPGAPIPGRFLTRLGTGEEPGPHYVIRTQEGYAALLAGLDPDLEPPEVDFQGEMVIGLATTGVEHFYIRDLGDKIAVFICLDQITIAIFAPELTLIAVPRDDRAVVFNEMGTEVEHQEQ